MKLKSDLYYKHCETKTKLSAKYYAKAQYSIEGFAKLEPLVVRNFKLRGNDCGNPVKTYQVIESDLSLFDPYILKDR